MTHEIFSYYNYYAMTDDFLDNLNLLTANYLYLRDCSIEYYNGKIKQEEFNERKRELLEDKSWEKQYDKLKGKEAKKYPVNALILLILIHRECGTLTSEEFMYYGTMLLNLMK